MIEDNYEDFERNYQEEGDDIGEIDAFVVQVYLAMLEAQGVKFPKEDPLNYNWTEERLMKYVEDHWPHGYFLPWDVEYPRDQFRWVGKKAREREEKLEEERRKAMRAYSNYKL